MIWVQTDVMICMVLIELERGMSVWEKPQASCGGVNRLVLLQQQPQHIASTAGAVFQWESA